MPCYEHSNLYFLHWHEAKINVFHHVLESAKAKYLFQSSHEIRDRQ